MKRNLTEDIISLGAIISGLSVIVFWIISIAASLAFPIVCIWAIYRLVLHFT